MWIHSLTPKLMIVAWQFANLRTSYHLSLIFTTILWLSCDQNVFNNRGDVLRADLGIGWGNTGITQGKLPWVPPRAILYGSGTDSVYCWITQVLPSIKTWWYTLHIKSYKTPQHDRLFLNNCGRQCYRVYTLTILINNNLYLVVALWQESPAP